MPTHLKVLWQYIWENANCAGIWEPELALMGIEAGGVPINETEIKKAFGEDILILPHGEWYIIGFIKFQYGKELEQMNPKSMLHAAVLAAAKDKGIGRGRIMGLMSNPIAPEIPAPIVAPLPDPGPAPEAIEPVKDPTYKEKQPELPTIPPRPVQAGTYYGTTTNFESIWAKYPQKTGKRGAWAHFKAQCRTAADWEAINIALANYLKSPRVRDGYIQDGETWFNNWKDWVADPNAAIEKKKPDDDFVPITCTTCSRKFAVPKDVAKAIADEEKDFVCRDCRKRERPE